MVDPFDDGYTGLTPAGANGEGDQSPDPFALTIADILAEVGAEDESEFLFDISQVDASFVRGQVFNTLEEVIFFLFDIGVISFGGAIRGEDGKYHPFIGDTPKGRRKNKNARDNR